MLLIALLALSFLQYRSGSRSSHLSLTSPISQGRGRVLCEQERPFSVPGDMQVEPRRLPIGPVKQVLTAQFMQEREGIHRGAGRECQSDLGRCKDERRDLTLNLQETSEMYDACQSNLDDERDDYDALPVKHGRLRRQGEVLRHGQEHVLQHPEQQHRVLLGEQRDIQPLLLISLISIPTQLSYGRQ